MLKLTLLHMSINNCNVVIIYTIVTLIIAVSTDYVLQL